MPDGFRSGFVNVLGHRLSYRTIGEPKKGTVLCLHGGPGHNLFILLPLGDLSQFGYRIVLYDQLGCGRSDRPEDPKLYTIGRSAREVEEVRRALRLGRVHLYGASYGGALALETALRYPTSFVSLAIDSGFPSARLLERETLRLVKRLPKRLLGTIRQHERKGDLENPDYRRALQEAEARLPRIARGRIPPWEVLLSLRLMNHSLARLYFGPSSDKLTGRIDGSLRGWDVTDRLGTIRLPTLVTTGRYDSVPPVIARRMHREIRHSRLVVFQKSAHDAMWNERERHADVLHRFLDSVARGR
jgi:proline iminopeptidase